MSLIMQFIIYRHNYALCQSLAKEERCCREECMARFRENGPRGDIIPGFSGQIGVPRSTLNEEVRGGKARRKAHEKEDILPPAIENAFEMSVQKMEVHGFPPKLDISKAMAQELAEQNAEQKWDSKLGKTWLESFLNHHSNVSSKFGSNLDRQRVLARSPRPIFDYFHKLKRALGEYNFLPKNIYGMGGKGFTLGMSNRAKAICRAGRHPTQEECVS